MYSHWCVNLDEPLDASMKSHLLILVPLTKFVRVFFLYI